MSVRRAAAAALEPHLVCPNCESRRIDYSGSDIHTADARCEDCGWDLIRDEPGDEDDA